MHCKNNFSKLYTKWLVCWTTWEITSILQRSPIVWSGEGIALAQFIKCWEIQNILNTSANSATVSGGNSQYWMRPRPWRYLCWNWWSHGLLCYLQGNFSISNQKQTNRETGQPKTGKQVNPKLFPPIANPRHSDTFRIQFNIGNFLIQIFIQYLGNKCLETFRTWSPPPLPTVNV